MAYNIKWTHTAKKGLLEVIQYLEKEWTAREISKLQHKIAHIVEIIAINPYSCPLSSKNSYVRKGIVDKNNYIAYEIVESVLEVRILDFGSTRKNSKY